jgi:hypothetical protein
MFKTKKLFKSKIIQTLKSLDVKIVQIRKKFESENYSNIKCLKNMFKHKNVQKLNFLNFSKCSKRIKKLKPKQKVLKSEKSKENQ